MSSNDDVVAWEQRWVGIVERVQASPDAARERARLGRRNVQRARAALSAGDPDQALVNAETALVNVADAVMQRDAFRVRGAERSHMARFEYPGLPDGVRANGRTINRARQLRNVAQYEGEGRVSIDFAREVVELADQAVREVLRHVA
jgi:hypothetical protein